MSTLVCKGLCKAYGKKEVLKALDLTLESGKIYGLIGRNGAGKTTLLSLLSNQNPLTAGEITLDGEAVWENRRALDQICFSRELNINAESGLAAHTVKTYLRTASVYYPHWDAAFADELVALFGLDKKAKLGKLSKGMLSMVTVTVALASKAPFTFLDEPVAGLDVVARDQVYRLLLEEYSETGRTFVVSTHIIDEAADLLEEVIILNDGKILLKENTQELIDRARYVTGAADEVEAAIKGLHCCHRDTLGRSMGATVLLEERQAVDTVRDVTVQPINLQKLFVALCGEEMGA